jgi:hypothetical protein
MRTLVDGMFQTMVEKALGHPARMGSGKMSQKNPNKYM